MSASSECTDREKQTSGMPDKHLTAPEPWSNLFQLFTPCCSSVESSHQSWYYSPRIQHMIDEPKLQPEIQTSRIQSEIEASKVHWSEVAPDMLHTQQSGETNREYFEKLKRREYMRTGDQLVVSDREGVNYLFEGRDGLRVGEKLAEGGQADIYEARYSWQDGYPLVVKVFKAGSVLQELEKQWPPALLKAHQDGDWSDPEMTDLPRNIWSATLLKDERVLDKFAFVMFRQWGDLRKLIDQQMTHCSHNQGPPFTRKEVLGLMHSIASFCMVHIRRFCTMTSKQRMYLSGVTK